MKKRIISALTSIPIIAAFAMSGDFAASCPHGVVNCPCPGQCGRYTDVDGDRLCDLSIAEVNSNTHGASDPVTPDQNTNVNSSAVDLENGLGGNQAPDNATNYHVLPITLILISGYLLTCYLFQKRILKRQKHKRIWNLLLTVGYIGAGVTGIILTLTINTGIKLAFNPALTFWHVELAILMVVGTLIHIHIYRKPFRNIFRVLFGLK